MIYIPLGRRELGKTTLAVCMARKIEKRVYLDPRRILDRDMLGSELVHESDDLRAPLRMMMETKELEEVVYQPLGDDLDESFDEFTREVKLIAINYPRQALAVLIDEASFYDLNHPRMQWLCKCTPREQLHIFLTTHRPADVPTSVRSVADHWFIFQTAQEHDLEVIEKRAGVAVANEVRRLKGRSYVHWNDSLREMRVQTRDDLWRVDLRASAFNKREALIPTAPEREFELDGDR
jgi:hypothetical protein